MKLYKDYIKEVFNRECYYNDVCFITYNIYEEDKSISIVDYYCDPEYRSQGIMLEIMTEFFDKFRREGYNKFYGYVDKNNNGWERSEKLMLKFGFKYFKVEGSTYNHYILEF